MLHPFITRVATRRPRSQIKSLFSSSSSWSSSSTITTTSPFSSSYAVWWSSPASTSRFLQTSTPRRVIIPPSPESLGAPRKARPYTRTTRWGRRFLVLFAIGGIVYLVDRQVYASGIIRSLRVFATGLFVAVDYKINFRPEPIPIINSGGDIPALHRRNAERLFDLLRANGGLYLKIGQAVAMQSAVLPPEFAKMFARMFDDAPQDTWAEVEKVIRDDFGGKSVQEVFGVSFVGEEGKGVMERKARASASVAQVHWARLADGREVAIKIQKPEIAKQIGWDLWSFKVVMWIYSKWFDLPLYSFVPFITERLMLETDFENEARNSETMRRLVAAEPSLRDRVYIPTVYPELTTRRVLTTEWIEGVRLRDKAALSQPWRGGRGKGSPGADGRPLDFSSSSSSNSSSNSGDSSQDNDKNNNKNMAALHAKLRLDPDAELKPVRDGFRGRNGKSGLGLSSAEVMTTMIDLFSAQIFKFGTVHCDPHPGNIFIRRLPSGKSQLVLIDHGLYVYLTPQFRNQYGLFWRSIMTFDNATIRKICEEWGIHAADIFASATLMRPYEGGDNEFRDRMMANLSGKTAADRSYEMQQRMRQGLRDMLADEEKWPKELIFIGRNMRIVQGNNQSLGSPVNRVRLMGNWASASLYEDRHLRWRERATNAWRHLLYRSVLAASDVVFYFFRVKQWFGFGKGMEDELEGRMKNMAKDFGVDLQHGVFEG